MTHDLAAALERFEQLLDEERDAIRRIDGERVAALADEKEALMTELVRGGLSARAELRPRFVALMGGLRRNLVLLAHAQTCVREALAVLQPSSHSYGPGPNARPSHGRPAGGARSRLSVRG